MRLRATGLIILAAVLCCSGTAVSQESQSPEDGQATGTFLYPIKLFRQYISGADGDRCAMHPSCSAYSMAAFRKHGLLIGWVMTCDRLMRCGRDEMPNADPIWKNGAVYGYDPVEQNDFWWNREQ